MNWAFSCRDPSLRFLDRSFQTQLESDELEMVLERRDSDIHQLEFQRTKQWKRQRALRPDALDIPLEVERRCLQLRKLVLHLPGQVVRIAWILFMCCGFGTHRSVPCFTGIPLALVHYALSYILFELLYFLTFSTHCIQVHCAIMCCLFELFCVELQWMTFDVLQFFSALHSIEISLRIGSQGERSITAVCGACESTYSKDLSIQLSLAMRR